MSFITKCCITDNYTNIPKNETKVELEINIIALINIKSGGGKGLIAFKKLKEINNCHPINILEFANEKERTNSENNLIMLLDKYPTSRILIGGGDGTITWGFSILDKIGKSAPVAILPIGTANEFGKCTGWNNYNNAKKLNDYINYVKTGKIFTVDLWNIKYEDKDECKLKSVRRPKIMIAFISFGFDASIAYNFHNNRELKNKQPSILTSKWNYIRYGIKEVGNPSKILNNSIDLKNNKGEMLDINKTPMRSLIILNINSMAGGVDFFGIGKCNSNDILKEGGYSFPKLNDGLIEIVGLKSVHHMNFTRIKLTRAIRIAQVEKLEIIIKENTFMEVDGEPFLTPKGNIIITNFGKREIIRGIYENNSVKRGIVMNS